MSIAQYLWLLPIGVGLGFLGTLIGAGGGFLLVPLLLIAYPSDQPSIITSISLAVVCLNAFSGSIAYARQRRIDYRSGVLFALATIPGAVMGALAAGHIPRRLFDVSFGMVMLILAACLTQRREQDNAAAGIGVEARQHPTRTWLLADDGHSTSIGVAASLVIGFVSTLLGIGGGVVHVPALVHLLSFPVHSATATSHFILAITAGTGTAVHVLTGAFHHGVRRMLVLGIGVIVGAPLGARLSRRLHGMWIMRSLAVALALAGLRLIWLGAA